MQVKIIFEPFSGVIFTVFKNTPEKFLGFSGEGFILGGGERGMWSGYKPPNPITSLTYTPCLIPLPSQPAWPQNRDLYLYFHLYPSLVNIILFWIMPIPPHPHTGLTTTPNHEAPGAIGAVGLTHQGRRHGSLETPQYSFFSPPWRNSALFPYLAPTSSLLDPQKSF